MDKMESGSMKGHEIHGTIVVVNKKDGMNNSYTGTMCLLDSCVEIVCDINGHESKHMIPYSNIAIVNLWSDK